MIEPIEIKKNSNLFEDNSKRYLISWCESCRMIETFEEESTVPYVKAPQVTCDKCNIYMTEIGWQVEHAKV